MSAHTAQTELKLIGKLIFEGEMHCETGLHVGAGKGSLEIGGADNPVVKDAHGRPYVPGSTLLGKRVAVFGRIMGYLKPYQTRAIIVVAVSLISAASSTFLTPFLTKQITDLQKIVVAVT